MTYEESVITFRDAVSGHDWRAGPLEIAPSILENLNVYGQLSTDLNGKFPKERLDFLVECAENWIELYEQELDKALYSLMQERQAWDIDW
jgi:hypothetical protein